MQQDFKKIRNAPHPVRPASRVSSVQKKSRRGMSAFPARERKLKRWVNFSEQKTIPATASSPAFSWLRLSLKMAGIAVFLFMVWLSREIIIEGLNFSKVPIRNIHIQGNSMLNRLEVLRLSEIQPGTSWDILDSHQVATTLRKHPYVHNVSVRKRFPDSLFIRLEEYHPVAALKIKQQHYLINKNQRILKPVSSVEALKFPVMIGLKLDSTTPGTVLQSPEVEQGLSFLEKTQAQSKELRLDGIGELQEVNISDILNLKIKMQLYPSDNISLQKPPVVIKLGNSLFYERLKNLKQVLPDLKTKQSRLKEIDLRFHDRIILKD